jgi:hypothetical protein
MKPYPALLFAGMLFCAPAIAERKIAIELGHGSNWSKDADAGFIRFSDALRFPNYPRQEGFYELHVGSWKKKVPNSALGMAIGTRERWGAFRLEGSAGVAVVENKTRFSGTRQQFVLRIGAGYTIGKFDFGVYKTHYSNAKGIFGWDGKNVGYDFITFQAGYLLK